MVPYLPKLPKYSLSYGQSRDLLAKFSIISAASPRAADSKIVDNATILHRRLPTMHAQRMAA